MKKKWLVVGIVVLFFLLNYGSANVDYGIVSLEIIPSNPYVLILNPLDQSYDYPYSETSDYPIDLNVTSNFPPTGWWYVLEDLECELTSGVVDFTPNTTLQAYRGENRLVVYANDSLNEVYTDEANFIINVSNRAPLFDGLEDEYFFCEDSSASYYFNANDTDGDSLSFGMSPSDVPFFIDPTGEVLSYQCNRLTVVEGEIFSRNIEVEDLQGNQGWLTLTKEVSVIDDAPDLLSDQKSVDLTIIEVNDEPQFQNDLSVYTIWATAPNNTFSYQLDVSDEESGDTFSGQMTYDINFLSGQQFFDINETGWINFTANDSLIAPGEESTVYEVELCVTDESLAITHPDIANVCLNSDDTPHDGSAHTVCDSFEITITNENRPPIIYPYYPTDLNFTVQGETEIYFNVTGFDPEGTTPSTYWYVNNQLIERDDGSLFDEFTYSFGCGVNGLQFIRAEATDGELNDSIEWRVTVEGVSCPSTSGGGGGGGGPTRTRCEPKWGCIDYSICQNTQQSRDIGILPGAEYRLVQEQCEMNFWQSDVCGYYLRNCYDVNVCNTTEGRPVEIQACHFSTAPSCSDGIKNCHDGACEFLVDCGGPCGACATCSDGIQNQGEGGIDCAGPCPAQCPAEFPLPGPLGRLLLYLWDNPGLFVTVLIIVALLALLVIRAYRVYVLERDVSQPIE